MMQRDQDIIVVFESSAEGRSVSYDSSGTEFVSL